MRKASVRTARKADLRPRRLFDFVSPAIVGTAIVLYVAVVLLVLYIRQNPFPGFGGYMNIVAVTAMNLFLAGMIIVTLYGKKADPYQAYGDRLRLIEMNVRTLVYSSIIGTLFISIILVLPALGLRHLTDMSMSVFFQLCAVVSFPRLRVDDTNFEVYKEEPLVT